VGIGQEFSFLCDGHKCAGTDATFDLLGADEGPLSNGKSLTVKLRHNELALEVSVVYICYNGHPRSANTSYCTIPARSHSAFRTLT